MSTEFTNVERQIIPRWRDSAIAATTGELKPLKQTVRDEFPIADELRVRAHDWRTHGSVSFASDLISAGLVLDVRDDQDVKDAIAHVLSLGDSAPPVVRSLAIAVSEDNDGGTISEGVEPRECEDLSQLQQIQIRQMKSRLRRHPRNGLLWVDLARRYAMLGSDRHAMRAMKIGLASAPDNRFALRSAARLYVHLSDPEQASHILRRSHATRTDPWLRAAEVAIAGVMDRTPTRLANTRKGLLTRNHAPEHISELASAVATFEMNAGSVKSARRLFNLGLERPTENAVAQADWAANRIGGISISDEHFLLPRSFEARAVGHFEKLEHQECIHECTGWLEDEPFSSRPVELGTFTYIAALEDYGSAIDLARRGLVSNPDSYLLKNNLSVALAETGELEAAKNEFRQIKASSLSGWQKTGWLATQGLFAFREDCHTVGRDFYERSVASAREQSDKVRESMVLIHWAREELKAGDHASADQTAEQAVQILGGQYPPIIKVAMSRYEKMRYHGRAHESS